MWPEHNKYEVGRDLSDFYLYLKIFLNISYPPDRVIRSSGIIGFQIHWMFLGQKLIYNILLENSLADNFRFEFEKSSVLTPDEVESAWLPEN